VGDPSRKAGGKVVGDFSCTAGGEVGGDPSRIAQEGVVSNPLSRAERMVCDLLPKREGAWVRPSTHSGRGDCVFSSIIRPSNILYQKSPTLNQNPDQERPPGAFKNHALSCNST